MAQPSVGGFVDKRVRLGMTYEDYKEYRASFDSAINAGGNKGKVRDAMLKQLDEEGFTVFQQPNGMKTHDAYTDGVKCLFDGGFKGQVPRFIDVFNGYEKQRKLKYTKQVYPDEWHMKGPCIPDMAIAKVIGREALYFITVVYLQDPSYLKSISYEIYRPQYKGGTTLERREMVRKEGKRVPRSTVTVIIPISHRLDYGHTFLISPGSHKKMPGKHLPDLPPEPITIKSNQILVTDGLLKCKLQPNGREQRFVVATYYDGFHEEDEDEGTQVITTGGIKMGFVDYINSLASE